MGGRITKEGTFTGFAAGDVNVVVRRLRSEPIHVTLKMEVVQSYETWEQLSTARSRNAKQDHYWTAYAVSSTGLLLYAVGRPVSQSVGEASSRPGNF
jgi:hypothetical protein